MTGAAAVKIGECSMGMKRRTALAAILVGEPQLVIPDEPSAGLDPERIRWLGTLLRSLAQRGVAVLTATHHLAGVRVSAVLPGQPGYSGGVPPKAGHSA
nr:AAA family ATPase [Corynebacterium pygosceleis]